MYGKIKPIFVGACLLALCTIAAAQETLKIYVKTNLQSIRTVNPADTSFSDLEAFGNAVGDKRVVMLGEQDHGDAPAFLAKTRLIKYLHEKKGFRVIAFESDFFGLTEGQRELGRDTVGLKRYLNNIFPIWTKADACIDLFQNYIPASQGTPAPLIVSGFDNQFHSSFSRRHARHWLDSVLRTEKLKLPGMDEIRPLLLNWTDSLMKNYGRKFGTVAAYDTASLYFERVLSHYETKYGRDYTWHVLSSMQTFNLQTKEHYNGSFNAINVRDAQMALNLHWLVNEKYKNEKIIVWAHNFHIMSNSWDAMGHNAGKHRSMGELYWNMPGNAVQSYVLGFTSYSGRAGRITIPKTYKVKQPKRNGFERWVGKKQPFAFIDFAAYDKVNAQPAFFKMKGKGHVTALAQWTRCFNGIFYIRDMYACRKVD
jgi:erythromycin esterase